MSFILDALKKSESDRQRQSGPSLFEVKVAPPRRTLPVWAVAIVVLLAINAIVISWMLLRHGPAHAPAAAAPPSAALAPGSRAARSEKPGPAALPPGPAGSTAAIGAAAPQAAVPVASPAAAPAAPSGSSAATAQPHAKGGPPPAVPPDQSAAQGSSGTNQSDYAPAVEPAGAQAAGAAAADGGGDLPLYRQIVTSAGLPELHLDLHVFAARPADRFVMINMQRLGEGDSLPDGVRVQSIRPDGAVLSYHGTRFLLPRN
jgi:general secretion pathway protein B